MKILVFVLLTSLTMLGQSPEIKSVAPDAPVARVGAKPITAAEVNEALKANAPDIQKKLLQDPQTFMDQYALVRELVEMAEKAHLDQGETAKAALAQLQAEFAARRTQILAQAEIDAVNNAIPVSAEDQKKFYEVNKDQFTQAKVKMLFISFRSSPPPQSDPKAKKILTEPEAKAKAQKLLAEARLGADFVKLVKENSDDSASAARDGDFDKPISRADNYPPEIMQAIFALKPGQISDPVRVSTGFYLFRMGELVTAPFEQVRDDIFIKVKQAQFNQWLAQIKNGLNVKIENRDFFTNHPAAK